MPRINSAIIKVVYCAFFYIVCLGCKNRSSIVTINKDSIIQAQKSSITSLRDSIKEIKKEIDMPPVSKKEEAELEGISENFYSIGATEDEVLDIQGEPTSVHEIGYVKTFFYGLSNITFEHGRLKSFSNSGNLKIRLNLKKEEKSSVLNDTEITMYVYFVISPRHRGPVVDVDLQPKDQVTRIYRISNYSDDKVQQLESCLANSHRRSYQESSMFIPRIFETAGLANLSYSKEEGQVFSGGYCNFVQNGINPL